MMKLLLLCAVVAIAKGSEYPYQWARYGSAPLNRDGTVADTPEVAALKSVRLAELAKAGGVVPHYNTQYRWGVSAPLNPVADTPAVAAAKAAHYAALARASGYNPAFYAYSYAPYYWYGAAPLNPDGTVADTPEVAHAKAVHYAALANAGSQVQGHHVGIADTPEVAAAKAAHFAAYNAALHRGKRWVSLNADGTVADTPEVAAAKAAHFAAVAKAGGQVYTPYTPSHIVNWRGGPAPLNPDGTVADTQEVQAAKAAHFAALAGAQNGYPVHLGFWIPQAPINPDGSVAETPEVIAKTHEHFAAHRQALARLG